MSSDDESSVKKPRSRDESKCISCDKHIRKLSGSHLYIDSREKALDFNKKYGQLVLVDDTVCSKCYAKLRISKSSKNTDNEKYKAQKSGDSSESTATSSADVLGENTVQEDESESQIEEQTSRISLENTQESNTESNTPSWDTKLGESKSSQDTTTDYSQTSDSSGTDPTYVLINTIEVELAVMPFPRTIISHQYCFMCKETKDLQDVPFDARIYVFTKRRIFIPRRNRCCKKHLIKKRFYNEDLSIITCASSECEIESKELPRFLEALSDSSNSSLHDKIGEYAISEERIKALTGYTWKNIITLKEMMITMRSSGNRNVTQALVIFLIKLRTGNSDLCISAILEIEEKVVQQSISAVLKCFEEEVLPKNFGYGAYSREFLLTQTSPIAKILFNLGDRLGLVCDGTYLRHQKSSNNMYQRKSYSGQKKTALCKPFTITTTNGFTVYVEGPYNANLNDAAILKEILCSAGGLNNILEKGDYFILDRGFRDVVPFLTSKGFNVLMPALKGKRNQLTVEESNQSRLVTKIRWVVEAVHGIVGQKCKLLHNQFHNARLPNAGLYCRIACFLVNLFCKRLNSDVGKSDLIIARILKMINVKNTLAEFVEENNWNKKVKPFKIISSNDLLDFPELTVDELQILFTGTYQLSQAICYLAEMLGENESLNLKCSIEENCIIRFEVKSRHINSKTYKAYVEYEPQTYGIKGIKRYCCNCSNGNRTVGCCSHVASIIYYLAHARYLSRIPKPAEQLTKLFDVNSTVPVIDEDSDED
ncbi:uncharacterized protein LOC131672854 [Phymastichus coffea]|uniref:uncharacterized protein LOC131672854 n=1 Tax=Phymastichus coffea TaxID=108790 RepID=UPI00273B72CA|nr:uncharacterized protein LOC131672854 [Phymastichus coffea]